MNFNNKSTIVGLVLLLLYFSQYFLELQWGWLYDLQLGEMFNRWTGLVLAIIITIQWLLTLTRVVKKLRKYAMNMVVVHKWLGALSPLFFYIHTMQLGFGYMFLLAYIFLSNTLLGYFNLDVIKNNSDLLFKGWMIVHVAFSIIITILMFFHITMVFYYK